jgi:hypothetical protein
MEELRSGKTLDSEQQQQVEAIELPRGVARTLARFVGSEEDLDLARTTLDQGSVDLVPSRLLLTVAQCLLDNQKLFGREGLSEIRSYSLFLQEAAKLLNLAFASLQESPDEAIQAGADQMKDEIDTMYGRKKDAGS